MSQILNVSFFHFKSKVDDVEKIPRKLREKLEESEIIIER